MSKPGKTKVVTLSGNNRFPFGKHKGERVKEVGDYEPSYIYWWDANVTTHEIAADVLVKLPSPIIDRSEDDEDYFDINDYRS